VLTALKKLRGQSRSGTEVGELGRCPALCLLTALRTPQGLETTHVVALICLAMRQLHGSRFQLVLTTCYVLINQLINQLIDLYGAKAQSF